MKKILFGLSLLVSVICFFFLSDTYGEITIPSTKVCTQEYAPVCGIVYKEICEVKIFQKICKKVPISTTTYSNTCLLESAGARFSYKGECKVSPSVCPVYQEPEKKEGCTIVVETNKLGCKQASLKCEDKKVCPVYKLAQPKEGCKYEYTKDEKGCEKPNLVCKENSPAVCTKEYNPICGTKKVCEKNEVGQTKCYEKKTTYGNKCLMTQDGASGTVYGTCDGGDSSSCPQYNIPEGKEGCYIKWEVNEAGCKKPSLKCEEASCSSEYEPVCGQPVMPTCTSDMMCAQMIPLPKTYSNVCELKKSGATKLYMGICKDTSTQCRDYSTIKLASEQNGCPLVWYTDEKGCKAYKYECSDHTDIITKKLIMAVEKLFFKLEQTDKTLQEKITYLENIYGKIKSAGVKNQKLSQPIAHILEMIQKKISEYKQKGESDDGLQDILDILK